jgi:hypothetical protein
MVTCPYSDCKKRFIYGNCSACEKVIYVYEPDSSLVNKKFVCCYQDCNKKVTLKGNSKTLFTGQRLKTTNGVTYFYNNPKKDPIEVKVLKSMIRINAYELGNLASVNDQIKDDDTRITLISGNLF